MSIKTYTDLEQGSDLWLEARCGLLTASVIGKLLTPTLRVADNETSRGVINTLAAERLTGHVEYVHPNFDMQRGTDDEPVARAVYAEHYAPVDEVGFITLKTDAFTLGFSPDGLVGDEGLIEIKSRKPAGQIATVFAGRPPGYNVAQLQTGLYVTGRKWLDYVSYSAGLPLFVCRVYPDANWFAAIDAAATQFEEDVTTIVANFQRLTADMPPTERRLELDEIRI